MDGPLAPPEWRPEEFGLRRALLLACLPVAAAVTVAAALLSAAPAPAPPIMVQLAAPEMASATRSPVETAVAPIPALVAAASPDAVTPAVSIEVAAPPLADIVEAESAVPVPPMPAPVPSPVRPAPTHRAVAHPRPAARVSQSVSEAVAEIDAAHTPIASPPTASVRAAPPAPADTSSGIAPYRAGLHAQIEQNMMADESVRRLGVTGVATIEAVIAPDGRVLSTVVARSSGNRAIDRAAQAAVQRGGYRAFGAHMPTGPITISVPITVGDG